MSDFSEKPIVDEIINFNMATMIEFTKFYKEGQRNIDVTYGDHWDNSQKAKFTKQDRLALNMPVLFPKVQSLIGFEKENRNHLEANPVGKEDELTTELITPLIRHIEDQDEPKKFEFTKSDVYADCIIPCYGVYELYTQQNDFKKEEVFIRHIPYNQILFDLNFSDYEMSGCRRFQQHWNCYLDDLIAEFPDKKEKCMKVDEDFADTDRFPQRDLILSYYNDSSEPGKKIIKRIRDWKKATSTLWYLNDLSTKVKYEFLTKDEAEEKRDELVSQQQDVLQGLTSFPSSEPLLSQSDETNSFLQNYVIESAPKEVWEYTEIAGTVLIEDTKVLEVPDECPITITFSIFMMGKWFTPVGIMRGLQEFIDRLFAQLDYSIGIDSKGGAEVDVSLLAEQYNNVDQLKEAYVKGDLVFKEGQGTLLTPMKRTGANPQYFQLFEIFFKLLEDGFGGRNFQGSQEAGGQQSGRAISQLLAVAQTLTNNYLDNLRRSDLLLGRKLLKYIKKYYDYEFTMSVLGESLQEDVARTLQENGLYQKSLMKEGKGWLVYDPANPNVKALSDTSVKLSLTKTSARTDEKEMLRGVLLALQQQGYAIPLEVFLDTMPIKATDKAKIIAYNKQVQEEQKQMQLQSAKMEALQKQQELMNKAGEVQASLTNAESGALMNRHLINQPTDQNVKQ